MINGLLRAVHTFARTILTSLSVDKTLMDLSTNFKGPPFRMEIVPSRLKHVFHTVCVHVDIDASSCVAGRWLQGFGLDICICKNALYNEKKAWSRRYLAKTITNADDADAITLLANTRRPIRGKAYDFWLWWISKPLVLLSYVQSYTQQFTVVEFWSEILFV